MTAIRKAGIALAAASLLAAGAGRAAAGGPGDLEHAVKATYIYKVIPFVTWPKDNASAPVEVCIAGHDAVSELIPRAVDGQTAGGKPIAVHDVTPDEPLGGCTVLYAAEGDEAGRAALQAARGKPILTVSDGGLQTNPHGIFAFDVVDGHVRFDIDQALAAKADLAISSKLLSLAHAVAPQT